MKVKVKRFIYDPTKSWEEKFRALALHHEEETRWVIAAYDALAKAAPRTAEVKAALREFGQPED